MNFCAKTRLDFLSSSKFAKMATILNLDGQRGVRAAQSSFKSTMLATLMLSRCREITVFQQTPTSELR